VKLWLALWIDPKFMCWTMTSAILNISKISDDSKPAAHRPLSFRDAFVVCYVAVQQYTLLRSGSSGGGYPPWKSTDLFAFSSTSMCFHFTSNRVTSTLKFTIILRHFLHFLCLSWHRSFSLRWHRRKTPATPWPTQLPKAGAATGLGMWPILACWNTV